MGLDWFLWLGGKRVYRQGDEAGAQDEEAKQVKVAKVDAKIGQRSRMRQMLQAVMAAECDSLTDCSCGLGCPLPDLEITGPAGGNGGQRRPSIDRAGG